MRKSNWIKIPIRLIDSKVYGRTQRAYWNAQNGATLLLHRPRSRNAKMYDRIGCWVVIFEDNVVRRKLIYGRVAGAPPFRWANRSLRQFLNGDHRSCCHLLNGFRPTIVESIYEMPVRPDELPQSLIGRQLCGRPEREDGIHVPALLPVVMPGRTIEGKYRVAVICADEFHVYMESWKLWTTNYPRLTSDDYWKALQANCLEDVFSCRLLQLRHHGEISNVKFVRLYHASSRRRQKARQSMLATMISPGSTCPSRRKVIESQDPRTTAGYHPLFIGWGTPPDHR